jgi:cell wall-associated NlpC family hydrolase
MNDFRKKIVAEAKTWLGTAFHHQGRIKINVNNKGGCDCLGLIIGVANALSIKSKTGKPLIEYDQTNYDRIPLKNILKQQLEIHLQVIDKADINYGDIVLFEFDKNPQHLAIISDKSSEITIIHAYAKSRKIVEHRLDLAWHNRIVAAYSFINKQY